MKECVKRRCAVSARSLAARLIKRLILDCAVLLALCAAVQSSPTDQLTLRSELGHFVVHIIGIASSERLNHMRRLQLSITTADGRPVGDATIALEGQRRYALNPLPTSPRITSEPEHGRYVVEGLRFHIPGEWQLVFEIAFEQIRDRVTLDVVVK